MRLIVFTMAAIALAVASASFWRQHWIAKDLRQLERPLANRPAELRVIRVEAPPPPHTHLVAAPAPTPPVAKKARRPRTTALVLPLFCNPTDPICGTER